VELPLLRSFWLVKKAKKGIALRVVKRSKPKAIDFEIYDGAKTNEVPQGTVRGGAGTCPLCGFTTPKERVRAQLGDSRGGASAARLIAVATTKPGEVGRRYRLAEQDDVAAFNAAAKALGKWVDECKRAGTISPVPDENIPVEKVWKNNPIRVHLYGNRTWGDLFSARQALALATFAEEIRTSIQDARFESPDLQRAVATLLAVALDRVVVRCTANCVWDATSECIMQIFNQGQALPARWEFAEMNPTADDGSGWETSIEYISDVIEQWPHVHGSATVQVGSAAQHPLPDDAANLLFTDPPYYDAVPYAKLSDFFYVWLKRVLRPVEPALFAPELTEKLEECVVDPATLDAGGRVKDSAFFEAKMTVALAEGRRIVKPNGLGVIVFAHKSTAGWEAQLKAMLDAGWTITASWPIDTESENRLRAQNAAALASSVHLVCRPRENADGTPSNEIGTWRAILSELPGRLHEWMPRLAREGVVGADAIFACLGPALEIFSRYARVEKASGDGVALREYLEHVWAAVAREALSMIFEGADASGLEEDARLTAMWLWTLGAGAQSSGNGDTGDEETVSDEDEDNRSSAKVAGGFLLEFDAARKIAQGLGAHLDKLVNVVEVKGDKARLLSVAERAKALFTKVAHSSDSSTAAGKGKGKLAKSQLGLFAEIEAAEKDGLLGNAGVPSAGDTTLDRLHQSMILFGAGRSEALKRFVVEEGVGKDARFWKLADSLSKLYPASAAEKRWVDGVLARKKSLGF
jgi:adenine-specific DNA methylase